MKSRISKLGSSRLRVAVLTSTELRHRFFANAVRARFPVVAIGYEETGYNQAALDTADLSADEGRVVRDHFEERVRQERSFFGHDAEFVADGPGCAARRIRPGELNSPETLDFLASQKADTVVVFGTNLIKPPLLGRWPGRMINMHLGLSPYYRGTATNFYPLLNLEPEYVGVTIHLIDAGIDSGPILRHARPRLSPDDMPHVIGCKTILAGIEAVLAVLECLDRERRVEGTPQWEVPNARLYLRKNYHQRQVVELYRKVAQGDLARAIDRANQSRPPRLVEGSGPFESKSQT